MKRIIGALAVLLAAPGAGLAQVPPDADWRTLESEHFRVTFQPGLDALAAHAADRAEVTYARLSAGLASAPRGKIDILLTDFVDVSNGSATTFPSNRIVLYAHPPIDEPALAYFGDWVDLVVTHELAHIFHLDATGRPGALLRRVFGRVPLGWPLFPANGAPLWAIEGLATYIESAYTGEGRVNGSYHDMVLRTAVLEGAFESIDRVTGMGPRWPGGHKAYIYGSMFADYLAREYGPEVHAELASRTAGAWIPPSLAFDRVAKRATGRSFTDAFEAWRKELETTYALLADSLRAEGLSPSERLPGGGYVVEHPRVAPDGRVAYAVSDGRSASATRILDPTTGRVHDLARRNGLDAVAWLPDGSVLTAQLEWDGPYRLFGDLYRVTPDGSEHRITEGARLTAPDATRDGRRVVVVQGVDGTNRLVVYDLGTGELRPLTDAAADVHWAYPRWSPAGDRIAVGRWRRGEYDVVVLDARGEVVRELTGDRAVDATPTWSPDGRYVLFSSDRSGIPNVYAYDLADGAPEGGRLRQVTNVVTGAMHPEVSPDGRWIYFAGYHADGFHIERVAFDPASWRTPAELRPELLVAERAAPVAGADGGKGAAGAGAARPYSAWRSLVPRFWLPMYYREGGSFFGAATAGLDLVGRHTYGVAGAYNPEFGIADGSIHYGFAGLGNPILGIDLWRSWEYLGTLRAPGDASISSVMEREDGVGLSATLLRRRSRSAAYLTLGAERVARSIHAFDPPRHTLRDGNRALLGVFGSVGFANHQKHAFSISREDGISLALSGLRRWDREPVTTQDGDVFDRSYDEFTTIATAYRALPLPGFARHVLALRLAGRARTGPGAAPFGVGGASTPGLDLLDFRVGSSRRDLPVRGFDANERTGTLGWTASLEYRLPIALIDRGFRLWPVYLDRLSAAAFLDAGDAWCTGSPTPLGCDAAAAPVLVSAGAELGLDLGVFFNYRLPLRAGVAFPLAGVGPDRGAVGYLQLTPGF